MDHVRSNSQDYEMSDEYPRKKLKKSLNSARRINWEEYEWETKKEKPVGTSFSVIDLGPGEDDENTRFPFDLSLEESQRLLADSETDLTFLRCISDVDKRKFGSSGKSVYDYAKLTESDETMAETYMEDVPLKPCGDGLCFKYSQYRGETPESNEGNRGHGGQQPGGHAESNQTEEADLEMADDDEEEKKTPDKSLFKKIQEQLMYECNLTPRKAKKKLSRDALEP